MQKFDTVLIRHAQSLFNQATIIVSDQLQLNLPWDELIQHEKFNQLVTYHQKYMDPDLSEKGRKQCEKYKKQCQLIKPDIILVSPYKRTLETCNRLFQNTKTPVVVEPLLGQVFRFACDVPDMLEQNIKKYPSFNFSKVKHLGDQWYLQNLAPQLRTKVIQKVLTSQIDFSQKRKILLQMLAAKEINQKPNMLRKRAFEIKKLIKQYKQNHKTVVVIAHYYIIQYLKSNSFEEDGDLTFYHDILNCHPYYEQFEELWKIQ